MPLKRGAGGEWWRDMRTASVGPVRENRVRWEVRWEQLAWKWNWGKRDVRKLFRNAFCVWCHAVVP